MSGSDSEDTHSDDRGQVTLHSSEINWDNFTSRINTEIVTAAEEYLKNLQILAKANHEDGLKFNKILIGLLSDNIAVIEEAIQEMASGDSQEILYVHEDGDELISVEVYRLALEYLRDTPHDKEALYSLSSEVETILVKSDWTARVDEGSDDDAGGVEDLTISMILDVSDGDQSGDEASEVDFALAKPIALDVDSLEEYFTELDEAALDENFVPNLILVCAANGKDVDELARVLYGLSDEDKTVVNNRIAALLVASEETRKDSVWPGLTDKIYSNALTALKDAGGDSVHFAEFGKKLQEYVKTGEWSCATKAQAETTELKESSEAETALPGWFDSLCSSSGMFFTAGAALAAGLLVQVCDAPMIGDAMSDWS